MARCAAAPRTPPTGSPAPPTTRSGTTAAGATGPVTVLVRRLALGPGAPRQPARVPHAALRRRRAPPPRRAGAAPARVGRLRPVPQGAGRRRPVVGRAHRPAAVRRPRPVGLPPDSWAEHFKEPLRRRAARAGRRRWRRSPRPSATRPGVYRDEVLPPCATATTSTRCWRGTAPRRPSRRAADEHAARRPRRWPTRSPTTTRAASGESGVGRFPFKPYCRDCGARHHHGDGVRRRDHRPRLHLLGLRLPRHHQPRHPGRGQAGLEGRLADALGLRARRLRARRHGPRDARARRSPSVTSWSRRSSGLPAAGLVRLRLRRASPASRRCRRRPAAPRPRPTRCKVLEAPILRWLYVRRQPKQAFDIDFGPEVVRLYDEWDALARKAADPAKRDAQVLAFERASATQPPAPLPAPRGRRAVPACCPRSPTSPPARPSRSAGSSGTWATPTTRSTTSSRGCRGRWPGPPSSCRRPTAPPCARRPTGPRSRHCRRPGARVAARCCCTGCRATLDLDAGDGAGLRRAQARARPVARRQADRRGEGGPEGVLPAALPPARRRRARPAAAHADRGARVPSGCATLLGG